METDGSTGAQALAAAPSCQVVKRCRIMVGAEHHGGVLVSSHIYRLDYA